MSDSQETRRKPSSILALVALTIVFRSRRSWIAVLPGEAAAQEHVSAEHVSRLTTKALALFEQTLARLTAKGRPSKDRGASVQARDLELTSALLEVATAMLGAARRDIRQIVVGAWRRLAPQFTSLTQDRFCAALALSSRTLRHWLKHPAAPIAPDHGSSSGAERLKPRPVRGRFSYGVLLPDTQEAADTTDLKAFGVPLKLIAAQDVGGRDEDLIDAFTINETETGELVRDLLKKVLTPGMQFISDQGTPYMAEVVAHALDELSVEHAPQREGDPLGKSTMERAFGTIKSLAQPVLSVTNAITQGVPALHNEALAKGTASLIVELIQKAYRAGSRAARAALRERGSIEPAVLARLAQESRARAVALWRSKRLLLQHIHATFEMPMGVLEFVRHFRRYPIEVLQQAADAYASAVTNLSRKRIEKPVAYFGAIAYRRFLVHRSVIQRQIRSDRVHQSLHEAAAEQAVRLASWGRAPATQLIAGLGALAEQWRQETKELLCGGAGLGRAYVKEALRALLAAYGPVTAQDIGAETLRSFAITRPLDPAALAAIETVYVGVLRELIPSSNTSPRPPIQLPVGRNMRPPPAERLQISAAGP